MWGLYAIAGIVGIFIGSFLNVVIYRGPSLWALIDDDRGNLARPRSYCPECGKQLSPIELIPIISYFLQKGACRACGATIPRRYPIVEFLGAGIALLCAWRFGMSVEAVLGMLFGWTLIVLAFIDSETGFLPDALTLPLAVGGIAFNTVDLIVPWPYAILGCALGYYVFWGISKLYVMVRGHEGLGLGDAKLLSAIGAWVGWMYLPLVVFVGALTTLAFTIAKAGGIKNVSTTTATPFGPGLTLGGFIALIMTTYSVY